MPRKIFYILKPFIPRFFQIFIRRELIKRQVEKFKTVWPIMTGSDKTPIGWKGWPENKKFAFVLTHDVELQKGHDRCRKLLEIERTLEFKSSFNFVPERYDVSEELRKYVVKNGFEVGVHGLKHDGKLFLNRNIFNSRAEKINKYLKEWDAVGFRAPAMHHNLEWIGQLNIRYDLSTFDVDPFEPQSDGLATIFPFMVKGSREYVELPYTLVQDFTLFVLMRKNNDIWKKKADWIIEKGGMVLLNVHPDYINFSQNKPRMEEYSINQYIDFLNYIKSKYNGMYWNPLPKDLADYISQNNQN